MAKRPAHPDPDDVQGAVAQIQADGPITWFGVKHYSPACALHLQRLIEALRPVAVLVEGPDDATPLIEHLVSDATAPPVTLFSSYIDTKNRFGLNGTLSTDEALPVRYRAWWPFVAWSPEYVALRAGARIGAELAFIDLPLTARIPFQHARTQRADAVVNDRHLATNVYFEALRTKTRRRTFSDFWAARFEVGSQRLDPATFQHTVHTFAWCARHAGLDEGTRAAGLEADGTLTRERHMRAHVNAALRAHPGGPILVVTGAFHAVSLPFIRGKKASVPDRGKIDTRLTPHSYRALSRLYDMARLPAHGHAIWQQIQAGATRPFDAAALHLIVEIARQARANVVGASTADAVGAWHAAQHLARLRGDPEITLPTLLDAVQMSFIKGDHREQSGPVQAAAQHVLVGDTVGHVTAAAGEVPLRADFYAQAKRHRLDLTGAAKTVRLDLRRQVRHRQKSGFLHQCAWLDLPLFPDEQPFRGPDPIAGTDLHLLGETWSLQWSERVDDRLLELADRGATLSEAAGNQLVEALHAATEDADAASRLLLEAARMHLVEHVPQALNTVEAATLSDPRFEPLIDALTRFVWLLSDHHPLPTAGLERLSRTVDLVIDRASRSLPSTAWREPQHHPKLLERISTLLRITLDRERMAAEQTLRDALSELVAISDARPTLRGAACGALHSLGAIGEKRIAEELAAYLRATADHTMAAGRFLDGLFAISRGVILRSRRLLGVVDDALALLDWPDFKRALPDLRRAFGRFIPRELDRLADGLSRDLGLRSSLPLGPPQPALITAAREIDARLESHLASAGVPLPAEHLDPSVSQAVELGGRRRAQGTPVATRSE